ncbi:Flagellar biosynthetic protein FlhB [Maioricimonas rarisocia]|uniref:Flagellar biosynthetic protein FlhB n=1 Tax=Maioricimonas rarisocia TaxID=2528026 RepID=A0A517ZCR0_9PLAN|nr:flagellar biosynthesis protein FlhB [Maioricimonas rarisocia]QDU40245.1 Flagellar biosynthetic protein FlhB [Maioricimonas rarisocia]
MADEFDPNKTEAPTPRRREESRKEGRVVYSPDVSAAVLIFAGALALTMTGPRFGRSLLAVLRDGLHGIGRTDWGTAETLMSSRWVFGHSVGICGGLILGLMALGLLVGLLQAGFLFTLKPLAVNFGKLDPVNGMSKLFSLDSLMRGGLSVLKVSGCMLAAGWILAANWNALRAGSRGSLLDGVSAAWDLATTLLLVISGALLALAVIDYVFRWIRHEQRLKMTREEVKDEQKQDTGDPQVRSRLRKLQKEAASRRSLRDVPDATVVVTNPTHYAVALKYESGRTSAPVVVAKGTDMMARRIRTIAEENGVPVLERKPLARALFKFVDVGQEIPFEFYRAIAELLAQVYRIKKRL